MIELEKPNKIEEIARKMVLHSVFEKKTEDESTKMCVICPQCLKKIVYLSKNIPECDCGHDFAKDTDYKILSIKFNNDKPVFYDRHIVRVKGDLLQLFIHFTDMAAYGGHYRWRHITYLHGFNLKTGSTYRYGPLFDKGRGKGKDDKKKLIFNQLSKVCEMPDNLPHAEIILSVKTAMEAYYGQTIDLYTRPEFYEYGISLLNKIKTAIKYPGLFQCERNLLVSSFYSEKPKILSLFNKNEPLFCGKYEVLRNEKHSLRQVLAIYVKDLFSYAEFEQLSKRICYYDNTLQRKSDKVSKITRELITDINRYRGLSRFMDWINSHIRNREKRRRFLLPLFDPDVDAEEIVTFMIKMLCFDQEGLKASVKTWKNFNTIVELYSFVKVFSMINCQDQTEWGLAC